MTDAEAEARLGKAVCAIVIDNLNKYASVTDEEVEAELNGKAIYMYYSRDNIDPIKR